MIQFIAYLVIFVWFLALLQWAWPVFLGLIALALVTWLLSLIGRRGRTIRRRTQEIQLARQYASENLEYERRQAEGRMWEEFGRQLRGDGS